MHGTNFVSQVSNAGGGFPRDTRSESSHKFELLVSPREIVNALVGAIISRDLPEFLRLTEVLRSSEKREDCIVLLRSLLKSIKIDLVETCDGGLSFSDSQTGQITLSRETGSPSQDSLNLFSESVRVGLALYDIGDQSFYKTRW